MDDSPIYEKTDAGANEVKARTRRLQPRLRAMLIMVDGNTPAPKLEVAAATLGAPGDFIQALLEQGLIRLRDAAVAAERTIDLDLGHLGSTGVMRTGQQAEPGTAPAQRTSPGSSFESRQRAAVRDLNETLGPSGESLAIRMEKARSAAELGPLLGLAVQVIGNARGRAAAEAFAAKHIV